MKKMINIFLLLRPHQWAKNMFCFLPLFFDRKLFDIGFLLPTILVFFAFSFAASGIYCYNDIHDVEADRTHPSKCKRPVASRAISARLAGLIMMLCFCVSAIFCYVLHNQGCVGTTAVAGLIALYIVLNIAYCVKLKHIAILDVFIISVGFVLRVLVGGFATGIWLSHWIILMTFLLALFLAFAKRRDDVARYEATGIKARRNINRYNLAFMNQALGIVAAITMVCYIMYTVSPEVVSRFGSPYLYITSVFVLAGIIRYLQLAIVDSRSGSPTKVLLRDNFIQTDVLCWILAFVIILYVL